ncbi:MAG: GNAT family N-acetyltransferase [Anaerolineaceae bacterium]|nr:GNAT family N-acetyltransferase [Anaerolineaceae bacterium]
MNWKSLRRLLFCESYTSKVRQLFMNSQHYLYLAYLGISPKAQGKGLGKAFVRHAQSVALERKEVLYLETHHQKNVDLYQRLGFRLIAENPIPGHSISFFNMVWEEAQTNS